LGRGLLRSTLWSSKKALLMEPESIEGTFSCAKGATSRNERKGGRNKRPCKIWVCYLRKKKHENLEERPGGAREVKKPRRRGSLKTGAWESVT